MPKTPLLSIITINFNDKLGLQRTFDSVFNQTFQDFEYIVIDGGSTDGSKELIEKNSEKISFWVSEKDAGIYNAMNKGTSASNGEYLLFLNSGDHFKNENSLEVVAKNLGVEDIIYFDLEIIGENNTFVKEYPESLSFFYFYQNSLPHPSTFIRKKLFDEFGFYDENLKIVSDWKWFIKPITQNLCTYKKISGIVSTFYQNGISSDPENLHNLEAERKIVAKEYFSEYIIYFEKIAALQEENKSLQHYKRSYNHLKKYKIVQFLEKLGLVKIY